MSDKKISQLTASTTPLAGTEVLPVVQSGDTKQVSVANLTAGRDVAVNILDAASSVQIGSVSQNETHQYMLSNWNTVNEFATRITSDYFGKTKIATTTIPTGSDPSLGSYLDRLVISGDDVEVSRGNLVIGTSGKGMVGGTVVTTTGQTSMPHSTATTIFALPSTTRVCMLTIFANVLDGPASNSYIVVVYDRTNARVATNGNDATLQISLSGRNIQVTQGFGSTQTVDWGYILSKYA